MCALRRRRHSAPRAAASPSPLHSQPRPPQSKWWTCARGSTRRAASLRRTWWACVTPSSSSRPAPAACSTRWACSTTGACALAVCGCGGLTAASAQQTSCHGAARHMRTHPTRRYRHPLRRAAPSTSTGPRTAPGPHPSTAPPASGPTLWTTASRRSATPLALTATATRCAWWVGGAQCGAAAAVSQSLVPTPPGCDASRLRCLLAAVPPTVPWPTTPCPSAPTPTGREVGWAVGGARVGAADLQLPHGRLRNGPRR